MFDIGFFELLVIGVVALLVIGPERLPDTIRSAALWWGRLKRAIQSTRTEIEQQIGADDIRRQLHNEEVMQRLQATQADIQRTVKENVADIQQALDKNGDISGPLSELRDTLEAQHPKAQTPEPPASSPEPTPPVTSATDRPAS